MLKLALSLLLATLAVVGAQAQVVTNPASVADAGAYNVAPPTCTNGKFCYLQTDANGQLKVAASVSASIAGFAPAGTYANLTATNSSADAALPAGAVVIAYNTGTTAVSCNLTVGVGSAIANEDQIQASSWIAYTVGSNTHISCIDQTGSASNVVVFSGGSGIPTGAGGGGGGSGGSVTQGTTPWVDSISTWASGTLGAMANYGTSPGAVLVPGVNAFVTNLPTGASTSANQSTGITALQAIQTNTNALTVTLAETAASSGVLKASSGNLYSVSADAVTATTNLKLLLFNATSRPVDGAVTPYKCISLQGNGTQASIAVSWPGPPLSFGTGITAAISSNTACTTLTNVTATITGQIQ